MLVKTVNVLGSPTFSADTHTHTFLHTKTHDATKKDPCGYSNYWRTPSTLNHTWTAEADY